MQYQTLYSEAAPCAYVEVVQTDDHYTGRLHIGRYGGPITQAVFWTERHSDFVVNGPGMNKATRKAVQKMRYDGIELKLINTLFPQEDLQHLLLVEVN